MYIYSRLMITFYKRYVSFTIQLLYEYHKGSTLNYWVEVLKYIFTRVSWPSGLAYRAQVLVLATECGFESRP